MRRAGRLVLILLFGFVCVALGARIQADSEAPSPAPAPAPKILVEKKEVEVGVIPDDCKRALEMAVTLRKAAGQYDTTTGGQTDIMDEAVKAIFERNFKALNDLITRQRATRDATVTAADTLHRELENFDLIMGKCQAQLSD